MKSPWARSTSGCVSKYRVAAASTRTLLPPLPLFRHAGLARSKFLGDMGFPETPSGHAVRSSGTLSGLFDSTGCSTHRPRAAERVCDGASARAGPRRCRRTGARCRIAGGILHERPRPGRPGSGLAWNNFSLQFPRRLPFNPVGDNALKVPETRTARPLYGWNPAVPCRKPAAAGMASAGSRSSICVAGYSSTTTVSPICAASISSSQYGKRTHSLRLYSSV